MLGKTAGEYVMHSLRACNYPNLREQHGWNLFQTQEKASGKAGKSEGIPKRAAGKSKDKPEKAAVKLKQRRGWLGGWGGALAPSSPRKGPSTRVALTVRKGYRDLKVCVPGSMIA